MATLLTLGCGGQAPAGPPSPAAITGQPIGADHVFVLDASGTVPGDTTVDFDPAVGRTVILRHRAPDDAIFLILTMPAGAVVPRAGSRARVTILPVAGEYGFHLTTLDSLGPGVQAAFSYARHFEAPAGALTRYGSPVAFESALSAARYTSETQIEFLSSERPGADMIRFAVASGGTYVLAAPR
jgi:hypothetical protein